MQMQMQMQMQRQKQKQKQKQIPFGNDRKKCKCKCKCNSKCKSNGQCGDLSTTRCALSTPAGKERPPGTPASVEMTTFVYAMWATATVRLLVWEWGRLVLGRWLLGRRLGRLWR